MHLQPRKRICKLHLLDSIHRRRTVRALGPPCPLPQSPHTRIHTITKVRNVKHNFLSALLIRRFILNPSPSSCPVSDDDAPAWWAWWPTTRLRWRTGTTCAHGWCRPRMM